MSEIAAGTFVIILIIVIAHYGMLAYFLRCFHRKDYRTPQEQYTPKTAVLLTLRGADPFLDRCLTGLLDQNYPDFRIFLIVDSADDPALTALEPIIPAAPSTLIELVAVDKHLETCALKCNSLCYAIERLAPSFQAVVLIDADVCPHQTWLRELVEPLSDPHVFATTGQRWYIPSRSNYASLIRYLWNAAAIVQMVLHKIPWGGSLALRRDSVELEKLLDIWRVSLTDDVTAPKAVKATRTKIVFVPSLVMVNREICSLRSFYPWVKRQLLMAKLYHPSWGSIVGQAIFLTLPLLLAVAAAIGGCFLPGERMAIVWGLSAIALYSVGVTAALGFMERSVRQELRKRGEPLTPPTFSFVLKSLAAIFLTQIVYAAAMIGMSRMKKVQWRGVTYSIGRDKSIRLLKYIPYSEIERNKKNSDQAPTSL